MIDNLFLSVGAMKAGTTWLYERLKRHEQIYFTPEKEIHYFANKVGIENQLSHRNRILKFKSIMLKNANKNPKHIADNMDEIFWYAKYAKCQEINNVWYESLFSGNPGKKFCADFSNLYCQMGPDGWENVRKVAKNVRVIYTLRDPITRLWSHYKFHMKWINQEDHAVSSGFENFKALINKNWFWVNAEYGNNYLKLKDSLEEKELMILYFEDFREKPAANLEKIQAFLDIPNTSEGLNNLDKKVNETKDFRMPEDWRAYAQEKLRPLMRDMKTIGIWHDKWCD